MATTDRLDGYPELLVLMYRHIEEGIERPLGADRAGDVAFAVVEHVRERWSGEVFYVPTPGSNAARANLDLFGAVESDSFGCDVSRYAEIMHDLASMLARMLLDAGMPDIQARSAGPRLSRWLRRCYGGTKIYIPSGVSYQSLQESLRVWEKFNGANHRELAREFNVSVICIYRRIARAREILMPKIQRGLF